MSTEKYTCCKNCIAEGRSIYKKGFCKKCYRWAMQLEKANKNDFQPFSSYERKQAIIALQEFKRREEIIKSGDCEPMQLEDMFIAITGACRSEIKPIPLEILYQMTARDRYRCFIILLDILENVPRDAPVLLTSTYPTKGIDHHVQTWRSALDNFEQD
ncbi:MAG: hypothetical protein PF904_04815 [Kiritimatiellae bacterium]|jgi:hypothetical protein|nr:hypothetical protein [Kiritimatiellia bacterium]